MAASPLKPPGSIGGRNFGLDIARSVAVLLVLFSHLLLGAASGHPVRIASLVYLGQAGVELFFSLSGFLIGGLLLDLAEAGPTPRGALTFWFRRWMRTLPLYYAVLLWATWYTGRAEPHAWFFLQNFYQGETKIVSVAWSLVLEEYFYFFFPLLMLAFSLVFRAGIRLVAAVALTLIVCCTLGRAANAYGLLHMGWDVVHENPFLRMDCAAYGVLAACLYRRYPAGAARLVSRHPRLLLALASAFAVAWGSIFVGVLNFPELSVAAGFPVWGQAWFVIQHSVLDFTFAVIVLTLFVVVPGARAPAAVRWPIRQCSLISYSIYLVHLLVIGWVDLHLDWPPHARKITLEIVLTLAVSTLTYLAIERPFLALRDVLSGRRRPSSGVMRPAALSAPVPADRG